MAEAPTSCANCGKAEELETKLKTCNACKLVKYCGRECQIAHRRQHKKVCMKRAAELHDEALFKQPPKGDDCPICFLLLPTLPSGKVFMPCCSKTICTGCSHAHDLQNNGRTTCPFCRAGTPSANECIEMLKKRVDANDYNAMDNLGCIYSVGDEGLSIKKDLEKAVQLFHRAAELGSTRAYFHLGIIHDKGEGVNKDEMKAQQYYEKAALRGCVTTRLNLGNFDADAGGFDRAIKHWLIAASGGDIRAVNCINKAMAMGKVTRDHYTQAFRGYSQYLDEIRSEDRDRAAAYSDKNKYLREV